MLSIISRGRLRDIIPCSIFFVAGSRDRPSLSREKDRRRSLREGVKTGRKRREKREWIGELEQRKLITRRCFLAAWLSRREREREINKGRGGERAPIGPAWITRRRDTRRDIRFCTTQQPREIRPNRIFNRAEHRNAHYYVLLNVVLLLLSHVIPRCFLSRIFCLSDCNVIMYKLLISLLPAYVSKIITTCVHFISCSLYPKLSGFHSSIVGLCIQFLIKIWHLILDIWYLTPNISNHYICHTRKVSGTCDCNCTLK